MIAVEDIKGIEDALQEAYNWYKSLTSDELARFRWFFMIK